MLGANFAVISFFPKLGEFRIANIGMPFVLSWRAKEGFVRINGDAVRAFFRKGLIWVVRAECRIFEKGQATWFCLICSREDSNFCDENTALWIMFKVVR